MEALKRSEFDQMGHIFAEERVELIRGGSPCRRWEPGMTG